MNRDLSGGIVATKNRETRFVPVGPETVARMLRWRLASGRPGDGDRVFRNRPETSWLRVRKAANLTDPQPRLHDLRHTCATFLLATGLRSHAVAEILGHADARLVDTLYGHALPDEVNGAALALETWQARSIATGIATSEAPPAKNGWYSIHPR